MRVIIYYTVLPLWGGGIMISVLDVFYAFDHIFVYTCNSVSDAVNLNLFFNEVAPIGVLLMNTVGVLQPAVTKFPTKYFRIEFMRREFVV